MQLFVYGTLKTGQANQRTYLAGQSFLGPARTAPRYRLFDLGPHPVLVECADGVGVEGELWDVDAACLERLDRFEGVDEGLFERRPVALAEPAGDAHAYLYRGSVTGRSDCGTSWLSVPGERGASAP